MNDIGLDAEWLTIEGPEVFFEGTKTIHNALHGVSVGEIAPETFEVYNKVILENASRLNLAADFVIIHDPQPLGLVSLRGSERSNWIWRCHIDVADADVRAWAFLKPFIDAFDACVLHVPQYVRSDLLIPQYIMPPFIDPLADKSRDLPDDVIAAVLLKHKISDERPFILQVSRFDRLKDPLGSLRAYEMVKRSIDVGFVFCGNFAPDDPEAVGVLHELQEAAAKIPDTIVIVNPDDNDITVNALQSSAAVVIHKALREGFGLVVTEAMWKSRPVVGGDTGGIAFQIVDGVSGFLVHTVEGAAHRLRHLLSTPPMARAIGEEARLRVQSTFLPPHYLRNWLGVLLGVREPGGGVTMLR
jgi:trehalose synthase